MLKSKAAKRTQAPPRYFALSIFPVGLAFAFSPSMTDVHDLYSLVAPRIDRSVLADP